MNSNKQQKNWDVITVGDVFIDIVMSGFAALPQLGEEVECERLQYEAGGGAAITACGLAKLGCRTALLAVVGRADSDWFRQRVGSCGVDLRHLRLHESEPTATTVSVSTKVDRAFFTYRGANQRLPEWLASSSWRQVLQQARHVHLATALAPAALLELAASLQPTGTTLSLDVGWHEAWLRDEAVWQVLKTVDVFFPNEREAEWMTGQTQPGAMLHAFADAGLSTVALKLGANGSALLHAGKVYFAAPHKVVAVDTTGAGDCFDAGFLYAWLAGKAPGEWLRIGNLCGALSTQSLGGIEAFPIAEQVLP
ncbi:MAG: carbohydrate kinase family protein [Blastocatellia bacterium]